MNGFTLPPGSVFNAVRLSDRYAASADIATVRAEGLIKAMKLMLNNAQRRRSAAFRGFVPPGLNIGRGDQFNANVVLAQSVFHCTTPLGCKYS